MGHPVIYAGIYVYTNIIHRKRNQSIHVGLVEKTFRTNCGFAICIKYTIGPNGMCALPCSQANEVAAINGGIFSLLKVLHYMVLKLSFGSLQCWESGGNGINLDKENN